MNKSIRKEHFLSDRERGSFEFDKHEVWSSPNNNNIRIVVKVKTIINRATQQHTIKTMMSCTVSGTTSSGLSMTSVKSDTALVTYCIFDKLLNRSVLDNRYRYFTRSQFPSLHCYIFIFLGTLASSIQDTYVRFSLFFLNITNH